MNRGVDHQRVFFADVDRVEFGRRLADIHERFGVQTLAYCLMDNHYHLLLRTPVGGLSTAMQHLGLVYTRHTNDRLGRDGPLFRGRFTSFAVTTDNYLMQAARYIHRNSLDIEGVGAPVVYRWSSYRTFLGLRRRPDFLDTSWVLGLHGDDPARLSRFTDDPTTVRWIDGIDDLRQQLKASIACHDIASGSDETYHHVERTALVLLMDRLGDQPLRRALARDLAFPTPVARRMALSRARRRADEPVIASVLDSIVSAITADHAA